MDILAFPAIGGRRAEQMALQMAQRRIRPRAGQFLRLESTALLRRQPDQLVEGPVSGPEAVQAASSWAVKWAKPSR